jgi:serine/threonine protein kinase
MPRLSVPGRFQKFDLLEELPEGASGAVYRAQYRDDMVVIKFFDRDTTRAATLFSYFTNEQLLLREMTNHRQHPHIVDYVTHNFTRKPFYVVTRYVEGARSLNEMVGRPLHPGFALRVVEHISSALDYAHHAHPTYSPIIHRDVKPANILIDSTGSAVLIDFSIARHPHFAGDEESGLGSPPYMPPEQYRGEEVAATDQFALAAVALHMLAGKPLLPNDSRQAPKKLDRLQETGYDEVRKLLADQPYTAEVLIRALAYDPASRYATCEEFAYQLRHALRQDGQNLEKVVIPAPRKGGWFGIAAMALVGLIALAVLIAAIVMNSNEQATGTTSTPADPAPALPPTSTTILAPSGLPGGSNEDSLPPTSTPALAPTATLAVPASPAASGSSNTVRIIRVEPLRASPSTDALVLVRMPAGSTATYTGNNRPFSSLTWYEVIYNGQRGWCRSTACTIE